jgi:processing peptidase subunit alpha
MLRQQAKTKSSGLKKQQAKTKKQLRKTTKRTKISLVQALTGQSNTPIIPLHQIYPGSDISYDEFVTPAAPKMAVLKNGMKVITQESPVPISHIALSVDVGSRFENLANHEGGITNFLERGILRSTNNRLTGHLIRDMAKLGADLSSTSSREHLMLTATTPTRINPVLGAMADVVKHAAYDFVDFRVDVGYYTQDTRMRQHHNPDVLVNEVLHQAAFGNIGLGQSMYMNDHDLMKLTPKHLKNWHNSFFVANRMTLAAVGVDHDSFVRLADEMFGGIHEETVKIDNEVTEYVGGNIRLQDPHHHGPTHVAFAWDAPSLKSNDVVAANVLQTLIGGGSAFSSGGPGKGMYTRLYTNILGSRPGVASAESFMTSYSDAGLLGVYAQVEPHAVLGYTEAVLGELAGLPDTINDQEVSRAKNMLKSNLLAHIGASSNKAEEMARNIQLFGEYKFPKFLDQIDAISPKEIKDVAGRIFRSDKPITVTTLGDASQLPRDISIE